MGIMMTVSLIYIAIALILTLWLASNLYRNGLVFLRDVFENRPPLAEAISRLLVTGFYMFSLGYAFLLLRVDDTMTTADAVQTLTTRLGALLISFGLIHLLNMWVFTRIRRRALGPEGRDDRRPSPDERRRQRYGEEEKTPPIRA